MMEACYEGELFFNLKRSVLSVVRKVRIHNRTGHLLIPTMNSRLAVAKPVSPVTGPWLTFSIVCFGTSVFPLQLRETFWKDFGMFCFVLKFKGYVVSKTKILKPGDFSDPADCSLTDRM